MAIQISAIRNDTLCNASDSMQGSGVDTSSVSLWLFVLMAILSGLGLTLSIIFLAVTIKYRKVRIIKMSSPNINVIIIVGGKILYITCVLFGVEAVTDLDKKNDTVFTTNLHSKLCQGRTWLLSLAFTLVFAAMFAKAWRVNKIFKNISVRKVVIKDNKLLSLICGFLLVDVLMLSLIQGFDPPHSATVRHQIFHDNTLTTSAYRECSSSHISIWIAAIFIYKGCLLMYGAYLSWATRSVKLPAMNDSNTIILAAYMTVIVGSIALALSVRLKPWPDAVYACVAGSIWLTTTVILCLVFIPKIRLMFHKNSEEISKLTLAAQVPTSPHQHIDEMEDEIYNLVVENRSLTKALSDKDAKIGQLQEHINKARERLSELGFDMERQDSGLDVSSTSEIEMSNHKTPSDSKFVNGDTTNETDKDATKSEAKSSTRRRHKSNEQFDRWKDTVANDLEFLKQLSSNLRDSIAQDLQSVISFRGTNNRDIEHYDQCAVDDRHAQRYSSQFEENMVESIAGSYNISGDSDTYSLTNSICTNYSTDKDNDSRLASYCSSLESINTIGNDTLYPPTDLAFSRRRLSSLRRRSSKRKNRIGRRGSWKREPRPKIYTIQQPRAPIMNLASVAFTRNLTDTYV